MNNKFAYIIPFKFDCSERLNNLQNVVKSLQYNFKDDIEIIIVEQGDWLVLEYNKEPFKKVKYISTQCDEKVFKQAWLWNIGACHTNKEKLIFGDADIIVTKEAILDALKQSDDYSIVNIGNIIYSCKMMFDNEKNCYDSIQAENAIEYFAQYPILFNREMFFKIGGFDEQFNTKCFLNALKHKINQTTTLTHLINLGHSYHQYHPKNDDSKFIKGDWLLLENFCKMNKEQLDYYMFSQNILIGNRHKYAK